MVPEDVLRDQSREAIYSQMQMGSFSELKLSQDELLQCNPDRWHTFFIHSSTDGHLDCFHILATVNNATVNTGAYASFGISIWGDFFGYIPRSGIAGPYGSSGASQVALVVKNSPTSAGK